MIFFVGALLVALTSGRLRQGVLLAIPILGAINLLGLSEGVDLQVDLMDYRLTLVRVDS